MAQTVEVWSPGSLSVQLWETAHSRVPECMENVENILFVARDEQSLFGLRRAHKKTPYFGFYALAPERIGALDGMTFRFAYLIEPSDTLVEKISPFVTELITIARRGPQKDSP